MSQAMDARVADLLAFINACPSPYHAVLEVKGRLARAGFVEHDLCELWQIRPQTRGFVVCAGGTILAFEAGTLPPAEAGFLIVGAHTDSPNLRLKPQADLACKGIGQFTFEGYGGVFLHTWFDRTCRLRGG